MAMDELLLESAGHIASQNQRGAWKGDSDSLYDIAHELRQFSALEEYKRWKSQQLVEAKRLLADHSVLAGVKAVACSLLTEERVSGEEARRLFLEAAKEVKSKVDPREEEPA